MNVYTSDKFRTWITCASYALLNVLNENEIDIIDLENSTGVTFGVASYGDHFHYTRMLTPFCTFWDGIDTIERVWGIHIEKFCFHDKQEIFHMLRNSPTSGFIIGALNMSSIYYLPLCTQYKCADHYIAVRKSENGNYLLTDSEGIPEMKISNDDFYNILNISDIPEARGLFNVGTATDTGCKTEKKEQIHEIMKQAENNYFQAEQNGQGGRAFLRCHEIMENAPIYKWATPLQYDLNYYIQRKYMFLKYTCLKRELKEHIEKQIKEAARLRHHILKHEITEALKIIKVLSVSETMIPIKWKEWVSL